MTTRKAATPPPTRDLVFQSAAVLFSARGFDGVSVDDIAARAGVNKAMIYYHFGSKQGLYRTLLRDTFRAAAARLAEIGERDLPVAKKIEEVVEAMAYDQIGRLLVIMGVVILVLGLLFLALGRGSFFGRLPGDINISSGNFTCVAPVVSMLLLSLLLTIILNVVIRLFNR